MLCRLQVRDFLLVEEALLEFSSGLNVLTGETGTGKSILLNALGLLLGQRGSADWIRRDRDSLSVSGVFQAGKTALQFARRSGIPLEGHELLLSREVNRQGPSRCFVNGQRVLVGTLRKLGDLLVETHGQRHEERFRRAEVQRDLLDLYGGHDALRRGVRAAFQEEQGAREALVQQQDKIERLEKEADWMRFQLEEIERIRPVPGEDERLRERIQELARMREQAELIEVAEDLLNGREGAILESLEELDHRATPLASRGGPWASLQERIRELTQKGRELNRELRKLGESVQGEEDELAQLQDRLAELEQLQRKHRRSLDEVLAMGAELRASLDELEEGQRTLERFGSQLAQVEATLTRVAAQLSEARGQSTKKLASALRHELDEIQMKNCHFRVALEGLGGKGEAATSGAHRAIGPRGAERVCFEVETNPGEGFRPLGSVASGGEMARIALALRVILGKRGRAQLVVFDEIDAGLGGASARAVAERLTRVSLHRQVLLVTHLPVIASSAATHLRVRKRNRNDRTWVDVAAVTGEDRVGEVARMLSGEPRDPQARKHAHSLLGSAFPLPEQEGSVRD